MAETIVKTYQLNIDGLDSVEDLRKAVEELNERLKQLNSTSKEYEETLTKLTALQDKLTQAMGGLSDSFKDGKESIASAKETLTEFNEAVTDAVGEDGLEGMRTKVEEVVETNTQLDESLTKEATSMKELRSQISGLKDRLVQLKAGTQEYEDTVNVLVEKQSKLSSVMADTKRSAESARGSYAALSAEMSALKKRWRETTDEAERADLGKRINEINKELKALDASIGNYQREVGSYEQSMRNVFGNPKKEIRELRNELANLEVGSERYNQVLAQMADLTQRQKHFQDQLRFSSANLEDIFKNTAGVVGSVVGGFSALNGMMNLFGKGNSDIQKAMLKTQSLIAIVQGMQGLAGLKDKIVGLIDGIKGFSSRFGMVNKATSDFTKNTKAAAGASQQATTTMETQAGAASQLYDITEKMSEAERGEIEVLEKRQATANADISVLNNEIEALKKLKTAYDEAGASETEEAQRNQEALETKQKELEARKSEAEAVEKTIQDKKKEAENRAENLTVAEQEVVALQKKSQARAEAITAIEKEQAIYNESRQALQERVNIIRQEIEAEKEKADANTVFISVEEKRIQTYERLLNDSKGFTKHTEMEIEALKREKAEIDKQITVYTQLINSQKQLEGEYAKLRKGQILSRTQKKLEIAETKKLIQAEQADAAQKTALAASYRAVATAARVASVGIKGIKTALISTGIGALLVLLGSALSSIVDGVGGWITGQKKLNAELDLMNTKTKELEAQLKEIQTIANGFGFSAFKKASMEITKMIEVMKAKQEEFDYAIQRGKKDTDELMDAWYDAQEAVNDALLDSEIRIDKLIADVEKADRQKGMTQLEKDLEETNKQFQDAIDLVRTFGETGVWSAERVEAKINSLNNALAKQTQLLTEAAQSGSTSGKTSGHTGESEYEKQRKEAKKLLEEIENEAKSEEQKLREKYEKEKKLLEKFHLDTTKLTEKYYKDLDKLMTERNKASYDKWKTHLEAELSLMQKQLKDYEWMVGSVNAETFNKMVQQALEDEIPVMRKSIDNMVKDFEYAFGKMGTPFEELFNIEYLDEAGSKAIHITDDIAEAMKEMGLDPTNIEDIEAMIDKWKLDKKAIEDANKELVKYQSNIKMTAYEAASNRIEDNLERMTASVETEYAILESESSKFAGLFKGWYEGLSPEQQEEQFRMRYQVLETGIQQEIDLWTKAANDETLTIEDRNTAINNLNAAIMRQNQTAAQKTIDANNLVIKSFQRVSNALSSMASSIAGIMGTVSDAIMDSAEAQLNAGKITEKAYAEQFEKAKAFQIAQATINTIAGAVAAFMGITKDTGGWGIAAAAIEAAAVLAAGFAQIQQIRNTKPETSGSGGGGVGGSTNAFSLPNVLTPEPQRVENLTNQSDIDALANALNDQRVYVLDSDIQAANGRSNKRRAEVSF